MADVTPTVKYTVDDAFRLLHVVTLRGGTNKAYVEDYDSAKAAVIAAVRAEMICPQCEAHGFRRA